MQVTTEGSLGNKGPPPAPSTYPRVWHGGGVQGLFLEPGMRLLLGYAGWQRLRAAAEPPFGFRTSNSTFPSALQHFGWALKRQWRQGLDL